MDAFVCVVPSAGRLDNVIGATAVVVDVVVVVLVVVVESTGSVVELVVAVSVLRVLVGRFAASSSIPVAASATAAASTLAEMPPPQAVVRAAANTTATMEREMWFGSFMGPQTSAVINGRQHTVYVLSIAIRRIVQALEGSPVSRLLHR